MEEKDVLESLDATGELGAYVKARKWSVVTDVCQRRLKKSNSGDAIKVLKIISLALDKKASKKDQSTRELENLLEKKPPVCDSAALTLLEILRQTTFHHGPVGDRLEGVWERATTSFSGNDTWIFRAWFDAKLHRGQLQAAKQAAMAWMKAYPKDHDPFYLFIFINDLIARSKGPTAAESRLSQMLANKALATAASDTAAGNSNPNNGRILKNAEDLAYLIASYKRQTKHQEALDIISSATIGLKSSIGKSSWELALQKLELQASCKEWESVWLSCESMLHGARPKNFPDTEKTGQTRYGERSDDWTIWDTFMRATSVLSNERPEFVGKAERLVIEFSVPRSRNAALAWLKLHSHYIPNATSDQLFKKTLEYFEEYSTKIACFRDLRPHLVSLSRNDQESLVKNITQRNAQDRGQLLPTKSDAINLIMTQVNALKLDYALLLTRLTAKSSDEPLTGFIETCLCLYDASLLLDLQLPQGDAGPADDAMLLAALASIRLFHLGQRKAIFKSIAILESLLNHTRLHYDALLLVVQLYMYFGMGSLAIDRYARLCVKNIQHGSMPWLLFPRISKIHPWPVATPVGASVTTTLDPKDEIKTGLRWYQSASKLMNKELGRSIHATRLNAASNLLETQELIQFGVGHLSLSIEEQNLRLLRPDLSDQLSPHFVVPQKVHDSRDLSALPNYEISHTPSAASQIPSASPLLQSEKSWLINEIQSLTSLNDLDSEKDHLTDEIETLKNDLSPQAYGSVTPLEARTAFICKTLERLLILSSGTNVTSAFLGQLEALQKQANELASHCRELTAEKAVGFGEMTVGEDVRLPLWYAFHGLFTIISVSKRIRQGTTTIARNAEAAKHKQDSYKAKLKEIDNVCQQMVDSVRERATQERRRVGSVDFKRSLRLVIFGGEGDHLGPIIEQSLGTTAADAYVNGLCESYVDAYDGVVRSCGK